MWSKSIYVQGVGSKRKQVKRLYGKELEGFETE